MKQYRITMNETIAYSILVDAESEDDAVERMHMGEGSEPFSQWTVETFVVMVEEQNE